MHSPELAASITTLVTPLASSLALSIWGIEVALGPRSVVRIYVENDKETGVTIEECAELSRLVGLTLEVEDILPSAYVLEVSSPGLERVFFTERQLRGAVGKRVELSLLAPKPVMPGRRKFRGLLAHAEKGIFTLVAEDCARLGEDPPLIEFSFEELRKVKQVHFSPEAPAPARAKAKGTPKGAQAQQAARPADESPEEAALRPLTPEEQELLTITGGCEAL